MTATAKPPSGLKAAIVQVTPFQQNCTLIWDDETKKGAVVDPGGDLDRIAMALDQVKITVEKIILTHGHIDHAGGAKALKEKLGVMIEGPHIADKFLLDNLDKQGAAYGMEAQKVTPDRWLDEGDQVTVGRFTFGIRHCPGHSPGSVVLLNDAQKFAIVGDVLFRGSIGRTDFPYGDHAALIHAIKTKLLPLGDEWAFICGHGPGSTIAMEKRSNPFLQG
ncbi:MAG: MBL fold metallo-hydrolase [Hyphomicrobiaceae bacterium]|nr:MBL fold metallo-hydrolase [Hyphomicrobiaceae bacterium]MCC0008788.1 MBL fold metallo-hydrolase [Hyphomicrobiaceae bacterium]